jgi:hypothetical protein
LYNPRSAQSFLLYRIFPSLSPAQATSSIQEKKNNPAGSSTVILLDSSGNEGELVKCHNNVSPSSDTAVYAEAVFVSGIIMLNQETIIAHMERYTFYRIYSNEPFS